MFTTCHQTLAASACHVIAADVPRWCSTTSHQQREGFHCHKNKHVYAFLGEYPIHGLVPGIPDIDLCLVECLLRDDMCWTAFLYPSTNICWLFYFDYKMNGAYIDAPSLKNTVCTKCMYLLVLWQELFMCSLQASLEGVENEYIDRFPGSIFMSSLTEIIFLSQILA